MTKFQDDFLNRIGRVRISDHMIREHPELIVRAVLKDCLIVRCEFVWGSGSLEYTICSMELEVVPPGTMTPLYEVLFTYQEDRTLTHEWRKMP